jgi:hypothetical protein
MKPSSDAIAIMIGKVRKKQGLEKGKEESDSPEMEKEEGSSDAEGLAQELIDAIKANDASAVVDAVKALVMHCHDEEDY